MQILVSVSPIVLINGIESDPGLWSFPSYGSPTLKILVKDKRYIANNREYGKYVQ